MKSFLRFLIHPLIRLSYVGLLNRAWPISPPTTYLSRQFSFHSLHISALHYQEPQGEALALADAPPCRNRPPLTTNT